MRSMRIKGFDSDFRLPRKALETLIRICLSPWPSMDFYPGDLGLAIDFLSGGAEFNPHLVISLKACLSSYTWNNIYIGQFNSGPRGGPAIGLTSGMRGPSIWIKIIKDESNQEVIAGKVEMAFPDGSVRRATKIFEGLLQLDGSLSKIHIYGDAVKEYGNASSSFATALAGLKLDQS